VLPETAPKLAKRMRMRSPTIFLNTLTATPLAGYVKRSGLVTELRRRRHLSRFLTPKGGGMHYGVFSSFSEARSWLPPSSEFHTEELSREYVEVRSQRIYAFDYPVLFWMRKAFETGASSIFDIGGSIGVHFYSYRRYLEYPEHLEWQVLELPGTVQLGRKIADRNTVSGLSFSEKPNLANGYADIWMAAGAIEFIEGNALETMLRAAARRPTHLFLNKLPMYEGEPFVSTHNLGAGAYAPHHVFNRRSYIGRLESLGYQLVDSWSVPERNFVLPGDTERSFDAYCGIYLRAV
jgi:putative methyltransferase (TIGR04325 family)